MPHAANSPTTRRRICRSHGVGGDAKCAGRVNSQTKLAKLSGGDSTKKCERRYSATPNNRIPTSRQAAKANASTRTVISSFLVKRAKPVCSIAGFAGVVSTVLRPRR